MAEQLNASPQLSNRDHGEKNWGALLDDSPKEPTHASVGFGTFSCFTNDIGINQIHDRLGVCPLSARSPRPLRHLAWRLGLLQSSSSVSITTLLQVWRGVRPQHSSHALPPVASVRQPGVDQDS